MRRLLSAENMFFLLPTGFGKIVQGERERRLVIPSNLIGRSFLNNKAVPPMWKSIAGRPRPDWHSLPNAKYSDGLMRQMCSHFNLVIQKYKALGDMRGEGLIQVHLDQDLLLWRNMQSFLHYICLPRNIYFPFFFTTEMGVIFSVWCLIGWCGWCPGSYWSILLCNNSNQLPLVIMFI